VIKQLKKKERLIYNHFLGKNPNHEEKEIKVICKERWGNELVVKCKVITKGWYEEVYLTGQDFAPESSTGKTRVRFK